MYREPGEKPTFSPKLHRFVFHLLYCCLLFLLAACASSGESPQSSNSSSPTSSSIPTQIVTPTISVPAVSSPRLTYKGHSGAVINVAWSPDGKRIASGGDDNIVHVWDAETGRTLLQYRGHTDNVFKVAWSPDGMLIASAGADDTVQVWRPQT